MCRNYTFCGVFRSFAIFQMYCVILCSKQFFFRIASKYNMRLVYKTGFHELFNEKHKDYGNLLHKMQALEVQK